MGYAINFHNAARLFIGLALIALPALNAKAKSPPGIDVTPAEPKRQQQPEFPAACLTAAENSQQLAKVTVQFDISRKGKTENISVVDSTAPCFNQTAADAVRTWTYTPQRMKGRPIGQEKVQTRFVFKLDDTNGPAEMNYVDATPIYRVPPIYPEKCLDLAGKEEYVLLRFTVDADGKPTDIEVEDASSRCFIRAAKKSTMKWRYRPAQDDGVPVARRNVFQQITFVLANGAGKNVYDVRRSVVRDVKRAGSLMSRGKFDDSETKLEELLTKYADSLSKVERALIYQIRGAIRLERKDYAGALDDLRFVRTHGVLEEDTRITIGNAIEQLENALNVRTKP
ncbi:MAG: TonB family protein [Pseudomonadota bacterium]